MSNTITINSLIAQQIGSGLKEAVIYNKSSTDSIWIGSATNTGANNGFLLGPLAHVVWDKDGPVYGALVSGSSSVDVIITSDISSLDNPVAVATATVTGLAETGIPNVFLSTVIEPAVDLALNDTRTYDVSEYASLQISMTPLLFPLAHGALKVDWHTLIPVSGSLGPADVIMDTQYITSMQLKIGVVVPVNAASVQITNVGSDTIRVTINATNRPVPKAQSLFDRQVARSFQLANTNVVSGTSYQLLPVDGLPSSTSFNGLMKLHAFFATVAGTIRMRYWQANAVQNNAAVLSVPAINTETFGDFPHASLSSVQWWVTPTASNASATFFLDLYPEY
jgi:hypothetical protein